MHLIGCKIYGITLSESVFCPVAAHNFHLPLDDDGHFFRRMLVLRPGMTGRSVKIRDGKVLRMGKTESCPSGFRLLGVNVLKAHDLHLSPRISSIKFSALPIHKAARVTSRVMRCGRKKTSASLPFGEGSLVIWRREGENPPLFSVHRNIHSFRDIDKSTFP